MVRHLPRDPAPADRVGGAVRRASRGQLRTEAAWTTRLGIGVFLVFFSAYDSIAGIGTGLAMRSARDLPAVQQHGIFAAVKDWPGFDPATFSINIIGTLGWVVAVGALALAARRAGAPRAQWILIGLAALFLLGGHPFPFGTLAFGSLFVAVVLREWHASRPDPVAAPVEGASLRTLS